MPNIAIVYHSGYGHTEVQAKHVQQGAEDAGGDVSLIDAADLTDPEQGPWDVLEKADAIVFGSPTYMGSVTGTFEQFADATSKVWFSQGWKDKLAAGFTNSGSFSGDKQGTLLRLATLAAQHSMIWVSVGLMPGKPAHPGTDEDNLNRLGFYLGAAAQSDNDKGPDEVPRASDLATARHLGRRVVEIANRYDRAQAA